jgi:hypothetical protein
MTNQSDKNSLNDADLDRLLAEASQPDYPTADMDRLVARVRLTTPINATRGSPSMGSTSAHWYSTIPLAASLLLGVYLGSAGFIDGAGVGDVTEAAEAAAGILPEGFDDIEQLDADGLT